MKNNPEYYWTRGPDERIDLKSTPWVQEVTEDLEAVIADPQLKLLVGPRVLELMRRAQDAPRRTGRYSTPIARGAIEPVEYEGASDGWYRDARTGDEVVEETDGTWHRITPPPEGAFTVGEMVRLDHELEQALERLAVAAEAGALTHAQRQLAGHRLGEAAENVGMRVMLLRLQLTPEEERSMKRSVLEQLAEADENPDPERQRRLKAKLKR